VNLAPHPQSTHPQNTNTTQLAEKPPELTEFDLGYYGWRVELAACLGVMAGFGSLFVYTFSVFVKPLAAEFDWSREAISSGFAIAAVTLGFVSPLLGRWSDRFGPRRIILVCMTIYVCAIASLSLLRFGLWQFYLTCFVLGLVGNGAAHLAYSRSISTWFQRRLGMALSFVMVGAGLAAMILPVIAQSIIGRSGWRTAYTSLGGLALLLGLPLTWRYIRERGMTELKSAPVAHSGMTWQQGLRSFAFWIITAILFVSSISMNGAITHLSALLTDRGLTAGNAALCASILADRVCWAGLWWDGCWTDSSGHASHLLSTLLPRWAFFFSLGRVAFRRAALPRRSLASEPEARPPLHRTC
jgi:MFS family permease